ncbi:MAG: nucleotidyltransferase domain-containing protein [Rhodocyclaceae bacterium]
MNRMGSIMAEDAGGIAARAAPTLRRDPARIDSVCDLVQTVTMYREAFERILAVLPQACDEVYGLRLQSLALFGSVARGSMRPDSDIDLLIVADPLPAERRARMQEFEAVDQALAPLLAEARASGVHTTLSPVIKTPRELEAGSLLYLDLIEEARILADRQGRLADFLARFAQRLAALGARRVRKGGGYYWELKPDYRWGDRIEL